MEQQRNWSTIKRRFEVDAGHRVLRHESKCANLHGHRYVIDVELSGYLDGVGRVLDFSAIKRIFGGWLDLYWDHNVLLHPNDPYLQVLTDQVKQERMVHSRRDLKMPWVMPEEMNPTAENMARVFGWVCIYLLEHHTELQGSGLSLAVITVHETPNCSAIYEPKFENPFAYMKAQELFLPSDLGQV